MLAAIRRAKTEAKASQKAAVSVAVVSGPADVLTMVQAAQVDLCDAGSVAELQWVEAEALATDVTLAPVEPTEG
ncbi:MAG: hypothetical protein RL238_2878 [Actinomycetota bacterium]